MTSARQEIAALERDRECALRLEKTLYARIAALEKDCMQARSLLLPNQTAVYETAMRWYDWLVIDGVGADYHSYHRAFMAHKRACARARKEK